MERMTALEVKKWLEVRTREFATATFRYLDALPKKNSTRVIVYQLGKSASSVGANYREANRGESGDDFRHKISIALKEANESLYWLEILWDYTGSDGGGSDNDSVPHGEPYAGNLHARFDDGAGAPYGGVPLYSTPHGN